MALTVVKGRLDARPTGADHRDFLLKDHIPEEALGATGEKHWSNPIRLNQQREGACVGMGWAGFLNSEPVRHTYDSDYAFRLYDRCTVVDDIPGTWKTGQEGTDVRVGAKVVQSRGHIQSYAFAQSPEEVAAWLLTKGPVVVGIPWCNSMDDPKGEYAYCYVEPGTGVRGWHCVVLTACAYYANEHDWFYFDNSWGPDWGHDGGGRFTRKGFQMLLNTDGAVAVTAVETK